MMDELRSATSQMPFKPEELRPILDCRTRWYSTYRMIERACLIMPAINGILAKQNFAIPLHDMMALERIKLCFATFKQTIKMLYDKRATLKHADKIISLLFRKLSVDGSDLAKCLVSELASGIAKRTTANSAVLNHLGLRF